MRYDNPFYFTYFTLNAVFVEGFTNTHEYRNAIDVVRDKCHLWLSNNLVEGVDYKFISNTLYFNSVEDLLAFRLACGL